MTWLGRVGKEADEFDKAQERSDDIRAERRHLPWRIGKPASWLSARWTEELMALWPEGEAERHGAR